MHLGLYGIAVGRRSLYDAQVACPHERELQGARYRGGRERERIYTHLQLAQLFLHRHAKLLFLIDDEQSQILELHALAYELVRAHHDVHLTVLEPLQHLLRVGSRAGTAQVLHAAGEVFQSLRKGAPMLVGQHGGGHQHRHLLVVTCRLEGSTHGHLGLAEAHVATHEAVHRALTLHVGLDVYGSLQLVGRVFVEEARLQLVLHEAVGAIGKPLLLRTLRVELDEVAGDILNLGLGALLELLPRARAQFIDARCLALLALVLGYLVQRVNRHEHHIIVTVYELDHLLRTVAVGHAHQSGKAAHTVVDMHHVVARLKLAELLERDGHLAATRLVATEVILMETVEYLMVGKAGHAHGVVDESAMNGLVHRREGDVAAALLEDGFQALGLLGAVGEYIHLVAPLYEVGERLLHQFEVLVEKRLGRSVEGYRSMNRR